MPIDYEIIEKIEETIQYAKKAYSEYINTGIMNHDLFKAVLLLAQIDSTCREKDLEYYHSHKGEKGR